MYFTNSFIDAAARFYLWLTRFFSNFQSIFLFLMRITWGHQFFIAGLGKFSRIDAVIHFFQTLGIPFPTFSAYLIATLEVVGGILLTVGLGSRLVSLFLATSMFVAYATAHIQVFSGFRFVMDPSILVREAPFPFLITTLLVLIFGPGKISIDGWLKRRFEHRQNY